MGDFGREGHRWKGPGCTAMKGPDYGLELGTDVWGESTEQVPSSCFPLPPGHLGVPGRGAQMA